MGYHEELLIVEAESRYHNDAKFHSLVFGAVNLAMPKTINIEENPVIFGIAISAASIALLLKERDIP